MSFWKNLFGGGGGSAPKEPETGDSETYKGFTIKAKLMTVGSEYQLAGVIDNYVGRTAEALITLRADDEKIDVHYTAVFRELLTYMMEDPRNITPCTHLLFCAKNLERIGDHATNIAENAYYMMVGKQLPLHRPKLDETSIAGDPH